MKILIVEDDSFLARVYRAQFAKRGAESVILESGEHVLETAKKEMPNVIVLDIMLPPPKNGFDVLRELKADATTKKIPVVMLSMLSSDSDIVLSSDLGAIRHIVKSNIKFSEAADYIVSVSQ
jgi:DNA-binding response OmpR family regulator